VGFLFSDLVMPGKMDGNGLVRYVRDPYPSVMSVIATGCSDRVTNSQAPDTSPGVSIISKPCNLAEVTKMIEDKLEGRSDSGSSEKR